MNHRVVCLHMSLMLCISPVSNVSNVYQYHGTTNSENTTWISKPHIKLEGKWLLKPLSHFVQKLEDKKCIFHNVCTVLYVILPRVISSVLLCQLYRESGVKMNQRRSRLYFQAAEACLPGWPQQVSGHLAAGRQR